MEVLKSSKPQAQCFKLKEELVNGDKKSL